MCSYNVIRTFQWLKLNLDASMLSNITKIFTLLNLYQFKTLRYKNTKMGPVNRDNRLDREHYWIETLRTSCPYDLMKQKGKRIQIYQLDFHYPIFQGQEKDLTDAEITSILTNLKTCNPYLTIFITILQMILKVVSVIYAYIWTTLKEISLKRLLLKFY